MRWTTRAGLLLAIAAVWLLAAAASLWVAATTSYGPVLWVINRRGDEGVHVGDVAALADFAATALVVSICLVRLSRRRHQ
jgi:hypothetical protein